MQAHYPIYCAGEFIRSNKPLPVIFPFNGQVIAETYLADHAMLERAIQAGQTAQAELKKLPTHRRADALLTIAEGIQQRRAEFAEALMLETGKPLSYARAEVDRAILTFTDGAEEAKRINGEWLALDRFAAGENHEAIVRRFPIGLVAAIAPFNFPLNLVAHKLAPALAAGCPIILKPASKTPLSALLLAELIDQTNLPKGAVSVLPMDRATGDLLVTDERFKLLTFTGSPSVGWDMKTRAGKKKVVLELGGNAAAIVTESAELEKIIPKLVVGAFGQSGQSCVHTQRIYVHRSHFVAFTQAFVAATKQLAYGDPRDDGTQFASMIDGANAERINSWVVAATTEGAHVLSGGERIGETGFQPTVLTNTSAEMKVCSEEAFAPVVIVEPYDRFAEALDLVNDSAFGLQAAIFTDSLTETQLAYERLEVGGVIINDVPNFRADHMPYGGVKDSGLGREGVRYAIEDMTELKTLVVNRSI